MGRKTRKAKLIETRNKLLEKMHKKLEKISDDKPKYILENRNEFFKYKTDQLIKSDKEDSCQMKRILRKLKWQLNNCDKWYFWPIAIILFNFYPIKRIKISYSELKALNNDWTELIISKIAKRESQRETKIKKWVFLSIASILTLAVLVGFCFFFAWIKTRIVLAQNEGSNDFWNYMGLHSGEFLSTVLASTFITIIWWTYKKATKTFSDKIKSNSFAGVETIVDYLQHYKIWKLEIVLEKSIPVQYKNELKTLINLFNTKSQKTNHKKIKNYDIQYIIM